MEESKLEVLMQSKNLVNTCYDVTAIQNRIFYYCLFSAQKEKNGALCCTVKVEDLKKLIPNRNQRTLANLKKSLQTLKATALLFEKQEEGEQIECDYNLIAGSEFNTTKEEFKIYFMERLYNHIMEYSVYAPLNLDIMSKFKSFYTQRLYELLRLWSRTGKTVVKEFALENLRFVLAVENKYPEYKNFKQRVLNQAIKEINALGNMEVGISELKDGRRVTKIEFSILDHEPKIYFKNANKYQIIEVDTVLNDAEGKPIPVKQGYINVDAIKENSPAVAPAEAIKYVCLPNKILSPEVAQEFINYCYENTINFYDKEFIRILEESQQETIRKKGKGLIGKDNNSYSFFMGIFKNKVKEYENNLSLLDFHIPADEGMAEASVTAEGEEGYNPANEDLKEFINKYSPKRK